MPQVAIPRRFTAGDLPAVQGFYCGDKPWAIAASQWIGADGNENPPVLASMARDPPTEVWLYYSPNEELVGFGALGSTKWPPEYEQNAILVQFAVASIFHGQPRGDGEKKYSHQILDDVIGLAKQTEFHWLLLTVDPENPAIELYDLFGFERFGGLSPKGQVKMRLRLL